jgi:hypothetical protein
MAKKPKLQYPGALGNMALLVSAVLLLLAPTVGFAPPIIPPLLSTRSTFTDSELTNIYSLVSSYNFSNDCAVVSLNGVEANPAKVAVLQDIADFIACSTSLSDTNTRNSYAMLTQSNIAWVIQLDSGVMPPLTDPRVMDIYTNFARSDLPLIRGVNLDSISANAGRQNPATNRLSVSVLCGYAADTNLVNWTARTTVESAPAFVETMTNLSTTGLTAGVVIDKLNERLSAGAISDFAINIHSDIGTPVTRNAEAGKFPLLIGGPSGQTLVIQGTTDFKTWTNVWTNTMSGSAIYINVPMLPGPGGFYRAKVGT